MVTMLAINLDNIFAVVLLPASVRDVLAAAVPYERVIMWHMLVREITSMLGFLDATAAGSAAGAFFPFAMLDANQTVQWPGASACAFASACSLLRYPRCAARFIVLESFSLPGHSHPHPCSCR